MILPHINKQSQDIFDAVKDIAGFIWQKGWGERNAGNISINITSEIKNSLPVPDISQHPKIHFEKTYPLLSDIILFVTAGGKRMRDIGKDIYSNSCLIKMDSKGESCHIQRFDDADIDLFPTSELPTHLEIHENLIKYKPEFKAVMHSHPSEIIALTNCNDFNNEQSINNLIRGIHPEINMFLPDGIGYVGFEEPGSYEIALKTAEQVKDHDVIVWSRHGCFSMAKDIEDAFDKTDLVVKAISIYLMCRSAGLKN
ncbi:MAG: rhamnulose-1-phosphate aldolase [Bacteroidota bacterium]|nr:rhamnulose-1-phosphate aldolase [Bacteroidota bacterium]